MWIDGVQWIAGREVMWCKQVSGAYGLRHWLGVGARPALAASRPGAQHRPTPAPRAARGLARKVAAGLYHAKLSMSCLLVVFGTRRARARVLTSLPSRRVFARLKSQSHHCDTKKDRDDDHAKRPPFPNFFSPIQHWNHTDATSEILSFYRTYSEENCSNSAVVINSSEHVVVGSYADGCHESSSKRVYWKGCYSEIS